jgi:predicted Zn-dependent peptidase
VHHELTTLPSGVTVVTEAMPAVRSVTIGMWIGTGSRDEGTHEAGCSHFLEHLLFKGTGRRTARQIAETIDAIGGEMNAFTSKELTCFYARVLDDDLPIAFEVLADMLVDARNRAADVEAERQVVLSEIDVHLDTPDDLVHTDFCETVLVGHPLALETLGSFGSITRMDRDTIHRYYLDRYRPEQPGRRRGGQPRARPRRRARRRAARRPRPPGWRPATAPAPDALRGGPGRDPGASDGAGPPRARGARPGPGRRRPLGAAGARPRARRRDVLAAVPGDPGGAGLAYATYSFASTYTDAGLLGAYVGTAPGKVDEALDVLRRELDRIPDDVTGAEVDRAKGALTGGTVLGLEDTGSRMSRLGKQVVTGQDIVTVDEALERIAAVELADVRRVADRILRRPRDLAVVGPFVSADADRLREAVALDGR